MNLIDDLILKLEDNLNESYIKYKKRATSNFEIYLAVNLADSALSRLYNRFLKDITKKVENSLMESASIDLKKEIIEQTSLGRGLGEEIVIPVVEYAKSKKRLEDDGYDFLKILYEKVYVDAYQAFEQYLFDCYKNIYMLCPKFLFKSQAISFYYDDIFENNNIEICREKIIDRKVKGIIQSNNIDIVLKTFKEFGVKIEIPPNFLESIFVFSKNRNVFTHNNGIINNIYIEDLKKNKILSMYKINDSLKEKIIQEINDGNKTVDYISKYLYEKIKSKQIVNYYINNSYL